MDHALGELLQPGNFLLAAGPTGGGKTILACQFAGHALSKGIGVLYISTAIGQDRCGLRLASAFCDIPYRAIVDGISFTQMSGHKVACPDTYGAVRATKWLNLKYKSDKFCRFAKLESDTLDLDVDLEEILEETQKSGFAPQLLILDQIEMADLRDGVDAFALRSAMLKVAKAMKRIAMEKNILAIGFCQADVDHYDQEDMDASCIAECKALAEPADAFIGISHLYAHGNTPAESGTDRALTQYFTVSIKGSETRSIPVQRHFAFQRFEDVPELCHQVEIETEGAAPAEEFTSAVRAVMRNTEHSGYVVMTRQRFREICELAKPNCLNLYYFLLLVADYTGQFKTPGSSFWSREKITEKLNLTVRQIRTASKALCENGFIEIDEQTDSNRHGRSLRYQIVDWEGQTNPKFAEDYLKLFRNLRDASREKLLGNPELLRLWLYCLANARAFDDQVAGVAEGHFILGPSMIEQQLGIRRENLDDLLEVLVNDGRIKRSNPSEGVEDIEVINWHVYQHLINPPQGDKSKADRRQMTDKLRTN